MIVRSLAIAVLLFTHSGCGVDCFPGFGGPTHTATLVIEQPFTTLVIAQGDSVLFQPENNVDILYQATDDECSDAEDYIQDPFMLDMSIANQSIATVTTPRIADSTGRRITRYYIHGNSVGRTTLTLGIQWYGEEGGPDDSYIDQENFIIDLEVF